jgi:hypothetical protein
MDFVFRVVRVFRGQLLILAGAGLISDKRDLTPFYSLKSGQVDLTHFVFDRLGNHETHRIHEKKTG